MTEKLLTGNASSFSVYFFRAALKLSEGIAIERESLVKQLDLLR